MKQLRKKKTIHGYMYITHDIQTSRAPSQGSQDPSQGCKTIHCNYDRQGGVDRHVSGGFSSQEVGGNRPVGMDWGERVTPGQALAWPGGEVGLCGNEYCGDRDARTPEPTIA